MSGWTHVAVIETAGNQNYIFGSNKRRENVGASELISQVGSNFVLDAIRRQRQPGSVQEVVVVSGKAILLVRDESVGRAIVREVTLRAIEEAPGVDVRGAIQKLDTADLSSFVRAEKLAFEKLAALRGHVPGPESRFARMPFVAECATSGLPASPLREGTGLKNQDGNLDRSVVSQFKLLAASAAKDRMAKDLPGIALPQDLDDYEQMDELDWLAVIHADGNGLGQVFLKLHTLSDTLEEHITRVKAFSDAIETCNKAAFRRAVAGIDRDRSPSARRGRRMSFVPIIPLIRGGDDITIVCDGEIALKFTCDYLLAFEEETGKNPAIRETLSHPKLGLPPFLGSCAGVAFVKSHYPFFAAYELASQLADSAKKVKQKARAASAIDWHVLYDSTSSALDSLRKLLTIAPGISLVNRPYVVTPESRTKTQTQGADAAWLRHHHWDALVPLSQALRPQQQQRMHIPGSQAHALREALYLGREEADATYRMMKVRYAGLNPFGAGDSLFATDGEVETTRLLDAMDLMELLPALETEENAR